jgi:hypothetical protein
MREVQPAFNLISIIMSLEQRYILEYRVWPPIRRYLGASVRANVMGLFSAIAVVRSENLVLFPAILR